MSEKVYLVVKSILNKGGKHEDYVLKTGDIMKLGRAKFLVRDLNTANATQKVKKRN
jgi:hypothetical protein